LIKYTFSIELKFCFKYKIYLPCKQTIRVSALIARNIHLKNLIARLRIAARHIRR
jgi:hypothetical protein